MCLVIDYTITGPENKSENRSHSHLALLGSSLQQFATCRCYMEAMAATTDDASALDQVKPGSDDFTCLWVEPWRHGAYSQIDPAIGAASQLLQLRDGPGLLST